MDYTTHQKDIILVKDLYFKKYIEHEVIQESIKRIANDIYARHKGQNPIFLVILNGSFMFSSDLLKYYQGVCEISFIRLSSYSGTKSTEEIKTLIGLTENIGNREVVILEDIIDSGITIKHLLNDLQQYNPKSIEVATLLLKPEALKTDIKPDYVGLKIPRDFIVGFGLDYDGFGRNLKDIYKVVEKKKD
ncbi:MAG: hypoxanthine phosphoribosyltransferase [Bacteroidota bacterium]